MQVIGLCRFSYPAIGGFQIEHATIADREAYLYDPTRMEPKFRSFETLTLPSIRAQTDPDFTFLIIIGDSLPVEYRERLLTITADVPQITIKTLAPGRHRPVMRRAINSVRQDHEAPCLQFRLDDDDAVAVTFVERLREAATDAGAILAKHGQMAIDFNQGHLIRIQAGAWLARAVCKPYLTAALGLCVPAGDTKTIMNYGHHKLHEEMPTLSFTGEDMFLRGIGDHNDSAGKFRFDSAEFTPLSKMQKKDFKQRFNVECD